MTEKKGCGGLSFGNPISVLKKKEKQRKNNKTAATTTIKNKLKGGGGGGDLGKRRKGFQFQISQGMNWKAGAHGDWGGGGGGH